MNYYLWTDGHEQGPYTLDQIKAAVSGGHLSERQTARREDSTDWKPLADLLKLKPAETQPKPRATRTAAVSPRTVHEHLTEIRQNTCYKALRIIVDVATAFSILAFAGFLFVMTTTSISFESFAAGATFTITSALIASLAGILIIAARQSALLLIDIADTLLYEHSKAGNR